MEIKLHQKGGVVRHHELKIAPIYLERVLDGSKHFELRKDDRPGGFMMGDSVTLREWRAECYTGRQFKTRITYVLRFAPGLQKGYVILGIEA